MRRATGHLLALLPGRRFPSRDWRVTAVALCAAALAAPNVPDVSHAATASPAAAERLFLRKLNAERRRAGLDGLTANPQLRAVARGWSATMGARDHLHHNPSLARSVRVKWGRLGENVGYTRNPGASGGKLVQRLHDALMASPSHRANILGDYDQAGIGVVVAADGAMWVTQVFMHKPGRPAAGPLRGTNAARPSRCHRLPAGSPCRHGDAVASRQCGRRGRRAGRRPGPVRDGCATRVRRERLGVASP